MGQIECGGGLHVEGVETDVKKGFQVSDCERNCHFLAHGREERSPFVEDDSSSVSSRRP